MRTGATTWPTTCAVQPDLGTMATTSTARRRGRRPRHPGAAGPRPQPHQRTAPVVRRLPLVARAPVTARLVRLGRSEARRLAPQQLGEQLRRPGVDPRRGDRAVLPAQPPARAARPQLVERGGPARSSTASCSFWFDRGVAGFRIDVCNIIVKDALLRDNPPATEDDDFEAQLFGQRSVYNANRPEVHDVIRRWRRLAESYDPTRVLVGRDPGEEVDSWRATTATAATSCIWPSTSRSSPPRWRLRAMRTIVEDAESAPARRGVAGVDRFEPRHVALRHPVGRGRPSQGPGRPAHAALPPGDPGAVPG